MPIFTTSDHTRLYYEDHGKGKPLVLIHGLTASHRHFQKQVPFFRKNFRVITYDLRGHGDSERTGSGLTMQRLSKDLNELIDYLGLTGVALVGWSLGAHVIFDYIERYGSAKLNNLCIIDMTPRLLKSDDWQLGLRGIATPEFGAFDHADNLLTLSVLCGDWNIFSKRLVERLMSKNLVNQHHEFDYSAEFKGKSDMGWMHREALLNSQHVIVCLWIALAVSDYRSVLPSIDIPCLITYGEESNYYAPETAEYMRDQLQKAALVAFAGCGHALHIQDADRFNSVLFDFLSKA